MLLILQDLQSQILMLIYGKIIEIYISRDNKDVEALQSHQIAENRRMAEEEAALVEDMKNIQADIEGWQGDQDS